MHICILTITYLVENKTPITFWHLEGYLILKIINTIITTNNMTPPVIGPPNIFANFQLSAPDVDVFFTNGSKDFINN